MKVKMIKSIFLSKYSITSKFTSVFVFFLSIYISPYYTEGDQLIYREIYASLPSYSFLDGLTFYKFSVSSVEPIAYVSTWVASRYLEKDLFIGIINAYLAYILMLLFQKWKVAIPVAILIVLTNFYIVMLYFAAERLKYGILFLVLSFLYSTKMRNFYIFSFLAILSHIQTVIIYGAIVFNKIMYHFVILLKKQKINRSFLLLIPLLLIPVFVMQEQILVKFEAYHAEHGVNDLIRSFVFFLMALYYSKNKTETFLIFIPILIAVFLVGGDRINMLSYFIFMYYALPVKHGYNIGVIATSIYLGFKCILFINNILIHNNGFYGAS